MRVGLSRKDSMEIGYTFNISSSLEILFKGMFEINTAKIVDGV